MITSTSTIASTSLSNTCSLLRFIDHISTLIELDTPDVEMIHQTLELSSLQKGDLLLKQGEISDRFYFNLQGLIRLYYDVDGEEKTAYFYPQNTFISAYSSFVKQIPSTFNLQVLQPSEVVIISLKSAQALLSYSPKFEVLARVAMEEELMQHQEIIASLLTLTPEQRYYQIMKAQPSIFQQVPQHVIASFIGVQPESLSRIKKRYLTRKS